MHAMDEIALVTTEGVSANRVDDPAHVVTARPDSKKAKLAKKYQKTPLAFYQALALGALLLILILVCVAVETWRNTSRINDSTKPHSKEDEAYHLLIVEQVNSQNNATWKARYNKFASRAEEASATGGDTDTARLIMKEFFNVDDSQLLQDTVTHVDDLKKVHKAIPKTFDVRRAWPQCWAVHQIFNQAGCGSCWSVAATSVMSDRVCISSNGTVQTQISALDLTSCCLSCGGCQGTHWALSAFTYWKEHGIVSGGAFGSHEGCRPYTFEPSCGAPCGSSLYRKERTPRCERQCQSLFHRAYDQDLVRG
ncbi:unnamed protein product [Cylicocyclus nassatus]|uniref:Peptidase C1A papain C-terminal domain-containing protein n=1 Tax=Cylicocyclus nassatus TaxID=53992 RepID=A0AA36MGW4_CYLNA|nr:unnamed protein product [Cylicocyclus nassatus]